MSTGARADHRNLLSLVQTYQSGIGLLIVWVVAFVVSGKTSAPGALFGSVFFSITNLSNGLNQLAVPGLLATGATFVIVSGGVDLSAGSLLGLLNCVCASWLTHGATPLMAGAYSVFLGTAIGLGTGLIVSLSGLQPFVVTLAAMVTLRGVAFVYTGNANVSGLGPGLDRLDVPWLGIPIAGWILLLATCFAGLILSRTVFGRRLYAVGGNSEAARYAGVPLVRVKIAAYAINGFFIAVAAVLFTARNRNGQPSAGSGYELDAITAAVVGGASLNGGVGNILGTFTGALFIVSLNILLILQGVSYYVGQGWKGVVILLAVYLQNLGRKRS